MSIVYRIRVKSQLELYWADWFGGMAITNLENGEAELEGLVQDQEALHRILGKIRDLNIGLIEIKQMDGFRNKIVVAFHKTLFPAPLYSISNLIRRIKGEFPQLLGTR
jgi:hypothetical protein